MLAACLNTFHLSYKAFFDARTTWKPPPLPKVAPSAVAVQSATLPAVLAAAAVETSIVDSCGPRAGADGDATRRSMGKDEIRGRLALLQGIYPAAQARLASTAFGVAHYTSSVVAMLA